MGWAKDVGAMYTMGWAKDVGAMYTMGWAKDVGAMYTMAWAKDVGAMYTMARVGPVSSSAWAGHLLLNLYSASGPGLSQKFDMVVSPDTSSLCQSSRQQIT